jgi:hypothetical protein
MIPFADDTRQVSFGQNISIELLPGWRPSSFKSIVRNCADQPDLLVSLSQIQNDFGCPKVDTSRHASYEHRESVMNSLVDLLTQSRLNLLLRGVQFLRSVSSETATV